MSDRDADDDLAQKQIEEIEETIATERRIVDELTARGEDTTIARKVLDALLTCRNLRRARAASQVPTCGHK
jgi:hypothetical protein